MKKPLKKPIVRKVEVKKKINYKDVPVLPELHTKLSIIAVKKNATLQKVTEIVIRRGLKGYA